MTASVFESATATVLNDAQRNELETLERAGTTTQKLAARCRVMLLAEQGLPNRAIARQVGSRGRRCWQCGVLSRAAAWRPCTMTGSGCANVAS